MDIINSSNSKKKGSDVMPPAALVEKEREQYFNELNDYFDMLKNLSNADARKIAKRNLIKSGIIDKKGNLTDRYASSREIENNE